MLKGMKRLGSLFAAFLFVYTILVYAPLSNAANVAADQEPVGNWGVGPSLLNQSTLSITTVSSSVYNKNVSRMYLLIQNQSAASTLTIKFGSSTVSSEGYQLSGGSTYEPRIPPTNAIYMKSSAGVIPVIILEGIR